MRHPRKSRWWLACATALVVMIGLAPAAMAAPQEVITDWNLDGFIQGHYSLGDLRNAPLLMQRIAPERVGPFLIVVNQKIERDFLGIEPPVESNGTAASPPVGDLPAWVVGGAIGAGLLVLGGTASAIYRRLRRDPLP